ncbi:hypothetical protein SDRG_13003 [Saprolegnia diclina VS20]|uniref:RING-type domain-containing protein n=1 Tax=Saprolegnia diclina (strain VS20) TaxID=1156394 RepID=T0PUY9_SAPDV|nr:hypothetical protein SDRG_13003 [Saprolegnia diclina VS20]EQC29334.1 hypothetical protein SDRG_13003 [Saprolegnia diclina VS20]|eukprot:XP_008617308.1 hypothetical protein SDRG_13003 [Saprolegnia diclina VS20]
MNDEIHFLASAKQLAKTWPRTTSLLAPWTTAFTLAPVVVAPSIGAGSHTLGYFVQYDLTFTCPITSRSWTLHTRYSLLLQLRMQLAQLHAAMPSRSLPHVLQLPFPAKTWDPERPRIIAERMRRFQTFVEHLWSLYASCVVPTAGAPKEADDVVQCLRAFLCVPEAVLAISVRRINEMPQDMDPCVVCLGEFAVDDLSCPSTVLELACGHVFHQACLQQWCAVAATCPTCRCDVGYMSLVEI